MSGQNSEWKPNGRPTSIIALNFSAALDDIFKLGSSSSSSELAMNIEQKKKEVHSHEESLQALNDRIRQATEQLKRLESKHKRMQSDSVPYRPRRGQNQNTNSYSDSEGTAYTDDHLSSTLDTVYQAQ